MLSGSVTGAPSVFQSPEHPGGIAPNEWCALKARYTGINQNLHRVIAKALVNQAGGFRLDGALPYPPQQASQMGANSYARLRVTYSLAWPADLSSHFHQ